MIFLSPQQVAELRKLPTTRISHIAIEESWETPLSIRVSEFREGFPQPKEYEIDQQGTRKELNGRDNV